MPPELAECERALACTAMGVGTLVAGLVERRWRGRPAGGLPISLPCRGRFADPAPALSACRGIHPPYSRAGGGSRGRCTPARVARTDLPVFGGIRCVPWPPLPGANTPLAAVIWSDFRPI